LGRLISPFSDKAFDFKELDTMAPASALDALGAEIPRAAGVLLSLCRHQPRLHGQ